MTWKRGYLKMQKFKTVVVGLDFSFYSRIVLNQAYCLAKHLSAKVVVVHGTFGFSEIPDATIAALAPEYKRELNKKLRLHYRLRPKVKSIVEFGSPADVILKAARKSTSPLIVVGHKGQSRIARFFLGSVAERVALSSPFPVWIHRGNKVYWPRKYLLPHDLTARAEKSWRVLQGLAGEKAQLQILNIEQPQMPLLDFKAWNELQELSREHTLKSQARVRRKHSHTSLKVKTGDPTEQVLKEARKFDVIVLRPHNRKGLWGSFGSVTAKLVRASPIPVLAVH
jgi:nucleotide-binding universal stress UspA family protein